MTAQYFVQDLILCLHHYVPFNLPLLSMGIQVFLRKWILMYSLLPQSQFSLETLPPLDSGSWWVWLTVASLGHQREHKNWRRWRRRELSMVWP